MMKGSIRILAVSAIAAVLAQSAAATTIEWLGLDSTTFAGWRSTDVNQAGKLAQYDPNGDHVYGSDGYYVAWKNVTEGNGSAVDIKSSLPSTYIAGVEALRDNSYYNSGYAKIDDPSQTITSTVADLPATGVWQTDAAGTFDFFKITLANDAAFVLTTILGTHDQSTANANAITITSSDDATGVTQSLAAVGYAPEYAFFKLSGKAGDTFTVTLIGNAGNNNTCTSGIAFEKVPEPSTTVMIISGIAGLLAYAWRKRK